MKNYIGILSDDIKRFINNYLIAGQLADVVGMSELEEYIPSKFPFLSILYLLNQNALESYASDFISKYECQLKDETYTLKNILGHFLGNREEIEAQKGKITELNEIIRELSTEAQRDKVRIISQQKKIDELLKRLIHWQEECDGVREKLKTRGTDIEVLKHDNETLRSQNENLTLENLQLKKSLETLESKFGELNDSEKISTSSSINNSKAIINISTTNHQDHDTLDLIDMGTSVLWRSSNLGAEMGFEDGDYFSWGALNSAEYFGSDVWGYNQVIKKNISGIHEFDAAQSILGEGYRIPTAKEWEELMRVCNFKTRIISIKGRKYVKLVSSITNKQLLLPVIGHIEADVCQNEYAQYWTAEQSTGKSAYICQIHETNWDLTYAPKWCGFPIRPIYDKSNRPLVFDDKDRMRLQIEDSNKRIQVSLQKAVSSLFPPKTTTSIISKKYPAKSEINESTIFNLLIKECLPYGKSVFEGDVIRNINLDITKLNEILTKNYFVGPISKYTVDNMTIKRFKIYILHLLSK